MLRAPLALALGAAVTFCPPAVAQEPSAAPSCPAEVRFDDGSLVRMTLLQENLEVMTRYGKLTIPLSEVRRVDFGLHVPAEVHRQLNQSVRLLSSSAYKDREGACRELLQAGHLAGPLLRKASRSADQEVAYRANGLLRKIAERVPAEALSLKEEDVIHTAQFTIVGVIVSPAIKAHSAHFGALSLKIADLRTLHLRHHGNGSAVTLDAVKHGSAPDQWLDTGIQLDASLRLSVKAEGQVDLWPQGPGQYLAAPKGYNTAGKGGQFMAGALIGKIGVHGKAFLIGEHYEGSPSGEGRLYLQIVPSPWNNASTGTYRVQVRTDHAALASR